MIVIDFETHSTADLRKVGAYRYAMNPDTDVILGTSVTKECMLAKAGTHDKSMLLSHMLEYMKLRADQGLGIEIHAWNAQFEYVIWKYILTPRYGWPKPKLEWFHCMMARAAYWGLPLGLDGAAEAIGSPVQKDKEGARLMKQMARPRSTNPLTWWADTDPVKVDRLQEYCDDDVKAAMNVVARIPPLPEAERAVWLMDQEINERGVRIDVTTAKVMHDLASHHQVLENRRLEKITGGAVKSANQVAKLKAWIETKQSFPLPLSDLSAATVDTLLSEPAKLKLDVWKALKIRQGLSKSSVSKLSAMIAVTGHDLRARGLLQYYGAVRTGRWAGRLVQPQNMPRASLNETVMKECVLLMNDANARSMPLSIGIEAIEMTAKRSLMDIFSAMLRSLIIAADGKRLVAVDLSQIEAKVLVWLAGQEDVLNVFRRGEDVYTYMAAQQGSSDRTLGKVLVLACGFGMGSDRFRETAAGYGLKLSDSQANAAVRSWRASNQSIVGFWYEVGTMFVEALKHPGQVMRLASGNNKIRMKYVHDPENPYACYLMIQLPSKRCLIYRQPELKANGDLSYMGVNSYTRKWERIKTYGGKLVENITQAVARDVQAAAMLRLWRAGVPIVMSVHDETVCEVDEMWGEDILDLVSSIVDTRPVWCVDLPVTSSGWIGSYYRKD